MNYPYRPDPNVPQVGSEWTPTGALKEAWNVFTANGGAVLGAVIVTGLISAVPNLLGSATDGALRWSSESASGTGGTGVFGGVGQLLGVAIGAFLRGGLTVILLKAVRRQNPQFAELFAGFRFGWRILLSEILLSVVVGVGLVLFVVPGVILALGFSISQYFIVDRDVGVIESLRMSWDATQGHKGRLFVLGLLFVGLSLASLLLCGLPLLLVGPLGMLALTLTYVWITGTYGQPDAAFGAGGMQAYGAPGGHGPQGGYGGHAGYGPQGGHAGYGPQGGYGTHGSQNGGFGPPPGRG